MDIPVYLFTGFLEAGKTKFIQETLCDERFNNGEKTLLLLCEEGVEEYDPSTFSGINVYIHVIDDVSELEPKNLTSLQKKYRAERVIVEYNGMWQLSSLFQALPQNWMIVQEFLFVDARTFLNYNANMRALVVDKLNTCELVVFNRPPLNIDRMEFHKIVRALNRRCDIAYEYPDGHVEYDDMEDPLPFDINAPVIEVEDKDYAIWYRDLSEELDVYHGKTVQICAMSAKAKKLPKGCFVIGRHLMTCCVDDITFAGLVCRYNGVLPEPEKWMTITAKISVEQHPAYGRRGPVLDVVAIEPAQKPEQEVATFY